MYPISSSEELPHSFSPASTLYILLGNHGLSTVEQSPKDPTLSHDPRRIKVFSKQGSFSDDLQAIPDRITGQDGVHPLFDFLGRDM